MDMTAAVRAFAALAQPRRLESFRLLVRAGAEGMPAGDIARAVGVPHNTMSSHLSVLTHAGLVGSRRDGRSIIYAIDFDGVRALMAYLMEDCCGGRPEVCVPALDSLLSGCAAASETTADPSTL